MEIVSTQVTISEQEALKRAKTYYMASVISRHRPRTAELHYFPYYGHHADFMLCKRGLFRKEEPRGPMNMEIIVSATGGKVSVGDVHPQTRKIDIAEEMIVDPKITVQEVTERAEREMRNVVFRRLRGQVELRQFEQYKFYRPYWIAFFGEKKEGCRLFYVPIPADAYDSYRTT